MVAEFSSSLVVKWVVRVRLQEEEDQAHDHVSDVEHGLPVGAQDVETHITVSVDVWVVHWSIAVHYGGLVRVLIGNSHSEVELGTHPDGVLLLSQVHSQAEDHDVCRVDPHLDKRWLVQLLHVLGDADLTGSLSNSLSGSSSLRLLLLFLLGSRVLGLLSAQHFVLIWSSLI